MLISEYSVNVTYLVLSGFNVERKIYHPIINVKTAKAGIKFLS